MKFLPIALALFFAFSVDLYAVQDDRLDELPFEEEEIVDTGVRNYGALGGGVIYNFTFMNFDDINAKLAQLGFDELSGPLQTLGGQGFTVLPWVPNLRVGFMGMAGVATTSTISDDATGVSSEAEYMASFTGLTLDYGIVLVEGLAILPGAAIGIATQDFTVYNAADRSWNDLASRSANENGIQKFEQSMFWVMPMVNIEWAFSDLFALRANASYNLAFAIDDWSYNRVATATDMPDITPNGFNVQIGLFIGLFNY
ncbi:MAG: hypothetical protein Kapaf2KO_08670 [Candidatus Kapaibacteriales bacterium]